MRKNEPIETVAYVWCIRNGYKVYPVTKDNQLYQVCIERGSDKAMINTLHTKRTIDKGIMSMLIKIYKQKSKKLL